MAKISVSEKEECVLRYRSGESASVLAQEYSITTISIYRWNELYDGSATSLEPKSSVPKTRHPKQMPVEEEQRIIQIVTANPQITDMQLSKLLGTGRNPTALHRKREKLLGKRIIYYKYDYSTLFSRQKVDEINRADLSQATMPNEFYVIEVVPNLFLEVNETHNPVSVTPYLTVALKFDTKTAAQRFLTTLLSDDMLWHPCIKFISSKEYNQSCLTMKTEEKN